VLQEFIVLNRAAIIRRCMAIASVRAVPLPAEGGIDHGVPLVLDQLIEALCHHQGSCERETCAGCAISMSAAVHGHDRLRQGLTVADVVHDYSDIFQAIVELSDELKTPVSAVDYRQLNRCLGNAIASAVTEFGRECQQSTLEEESSRVGFLAHELRNLLNTSILAFEVLRTGKIGAAGSAGTVLLRNLIGARDLVARSVADVRVTQGVLNCEQFLVSGFIEELAAAARLAADARGITLRLMPVDGDVVIEADRQVLAAVVTNILQNAIKFTRLRTTVTLRVDASAERVLIEVQDECGGLPGGSDSNLFHPFEQRSPDRTGLGLGLAFSRWGAEANHGRLYARNLPDVGCVFTVDLPRIPALAHATV
jgi:signal transduction histidine kinase